jgi:tetratricopeptide (TPR) repeat protein
VPAPEKKSQVSSKPAEKPEEPTPAPSAGEDEAQAAQADGLSTEVLAMADSLFERGAQATVRGNFDYAIRLYLDGLKLNPRDIEKGHKGLRECALRRTNTGKGRGLRSLLGQAKGAWSQMLGRHKNTMLALEEALARDPQNVMLLTQLMQTARRQEFTDVAIYFGEIAAEETLRTKKPQKQIFTTLADLYETRGRLKEAIDALTQAVRIDPSERMLEKRARDLAARASIEDGGLESVTDFHEIIRDRAQAVQAATQQVVRTREQLDAQYEELTAALDADPKNPVKMQALADCQARRGYVQEAMDLLQTALDMTKEYRYKARMDDIRMSEFRRVLREIDEQLQNKPDRADLKAKRDETAVQRDAFELRIYTERQRQYPTDLSIRYELGLRQFRIGQYDEAIVSFQTSQRDPKRYVPSLNWAGKCFLAKKMHEIAQSQFEEAIQKYELTNDPLGKELRYNLARTFEIQGKLPQAMEWYSMIVREDYQYKDAAKRLDALRKAAQTEGRA